MTGVNRNSCLCRLVEFFELLNSCVATLELENTQFYKNIMGVQKKLVICSSLFEQYQELKLFSKE